MCVPCEQVLSTLLVATSMTRAPQPCPRLVDAVERGSAHVLADRLP